MASSCKRCGIEGPALANSQTGPVCQLCAEAIARETGEWIQLGPRVITNHGYVIAKKHRHDEPDSDPALAAEIVAMRRIAMKLARAAPTRMDRDVLVCALCDWVVGYRGPTGDREHERDCPVGEAAQYTGVKVEMS
jgi:hypothetical protein